MDRNQHVHATFTTSLTFTQEHVLLATIPALLAQELQRQVVPIAIQMRLFQQVFALALPGII
jgi:hypothetical protein